MDTEEKDREVDADANQSLLHQDRQVDHQPATRSINATLHSTDTNVLPLPPQSFALQTFLTSPHSYFHRDTTALRSMHSQRMALSRVYFRLLIYAVTLVTISLSIIFSLSYVNTNFFCQYDTQSKQHMITNHQSESSNELSLNVRGLLIDVVPSSNTSIHTSVLPIPVQDSSHVSRQVHQQEDSDHTVVRFSSDHAQSWLGITSLPNRGAGVGHQFGEWIYAPYLTTYTAHHYEERKQLSSKRKISMHGSVSTNVTSNINERLISLPHRPSQFMTVASLLYQRAQARLNQTVGQGQEKDRDFKPTYIYTPLKKKAEQFNHFLGLKLNEVEEDVFLQTWNGTVRVIERKDNEKMAVFDVTSSSPRYVYLSTLHWIEQVLHNITLEVTDDILLLLHSNQTVKQQFMHAFNLSAAEYDMIYSYLNGKDGSLWQETLSFLLKEPIIRSQLPYALPLNHPKASLLSEWIPFPLYIKLSSIHIPTFDYACQPRLQWVLQRKLCSSLAQNRMIDVFEASLLSRKQPGPSNSSLNARNQFIPEINESKPKLLHIAIHYRCGDSCFNYYRTTTFSSLLNTTVTLFHELQEHHPSFEPYFHLFSQAPHNDTAEHHFEPFLTALSVLGIRIFTHFDLNNIQTLHHLITSDILIASSRSSFSWLAIVYRQKLSLAPKEIEACRLAVTYNHKTGQFNHAQFHKYFEMSMNFQKKTTDHCDTPELFEHMLITDKEWDDL